MPESLIHDTMNLNFYKKLKQCMEREDAKPKHKQTNSTFDRKEKLLMHDTIYILPVAGANRQKLRMRTSPPVISKVGVAVTATDELIAAKLACAYQVQEVFHKVKDVFHTV